MAIALQKFTVDGKAGQIEGLVHMPDDIPCALAVVAHPLPTMGGNMDNKVAVMLAKTFAEMGCVAVRFNFRGVGASEGAWSGGRDEPADLADAVAHARAVAPGLPVAVVGFSFGALMTLRWIAQGGHPDAFALLGLPLRTVRGEPHTDLPAVPPGTLVVNGELDTFGAAEEIREAYPQARVVAIPGSDHFFMGKRDEAAHAVMDHLALALASP